MKKIFLGADHGGFALKEKVKSWLATQGYQVQDLGADELMPQDDYPQYAVAVGTAVAQNSNSVGILLCRSGGGVTIAANKINGVRAVAAKDNQTAAHARTDNNANVLSIAADWLNFNQAQAIITTFLTTDFSQKERHRRRIKQIQHLETVNK